MLAASYTLSTFGTVKSMLNSLLEDPVCSVPMDTQATITGLLIYLGKLKKTLLLQGNLHSCKKGLFSYNL